jgi:hypothetical protein
LASSSPVLQTQKVFELSVSLLCLLLQLRKLVATQEELQDQLAAQLAACQSDADAAADAAAAQQEQLQQHLDEAQAAVAALAEELKVGTSGRCCGVGCGMIVHQRHPAQLLCSSRQLRSAALLLLR